MNNHFFILYNVIIVLYRILDYNKYNGGTKSMVVIIVMVSVRDAPVVSGKCMIMCIVQNKE